MSFCTVLHEIGAPVDRYLRRQKLPVLCENPNMYVPLQRAWSFFYDTTQQNEEALGWLVGLDVGNQNLNAGLLEHVKSSPTLFDGLKRFVKLACTEATHIDLGVQASNKNIVLYTRYLDKKDSTGRFTSQVYQIGVMLDLVRFFLGQEWVPTKIGIEDSIVPSNINELFPGTQILTQQDMGYIVIPRNCLYKPIHKPQIKTQTASVPEPGKNLDDVNTLRTVIKSYLSDGYPSARFASELLDISERTLARKLSARDLTYGNMIDEVRFEVATELLKKENMRIADIASAVGFSDQANFTRMFRRLCGMTPSEFQQET